MVAAPRRGSAHSKAPLGETDLKLWRLDSSDAGRHVWHYLGATEVNEVAGPCPFNADTPQSFEDKHWLGLPTVMPARTPATMDC
jgi:hypothetical protein